MMSRAVPSIIKDIRLDAQESARDDSPAPNVSVADWLDAFIADDRVTSTPAVLPSRKGIDLSTIKQDPGEEALSATREAPFEVEATRTDRRAPSSGQSAAEQAPRKALAFQVGQASHEDGRLKEQMIREAVAAITRRQAALDADGPPAENEPPAPIPPPPGATLTEIGHAISALESRLTTVRSAKPDDPKSARTIPAVYARPSPLDEEASHAFDTLGQDLRQAVEAIDRRLRPDAIAQGKPRAHAAARSEDAHGRVSDLLSTTARAPSIGRPSPTPSASSTHSSQPNGGEEIWTDIRALLDRLGPGSSIEALDRRMQDLTVKVEHHIGAPSASALIEDLSRRIDALQSSLKSPVADRQAFDQLLQSIDERIGKIRSDSINVQHLEEMMNNLARRIEDTRFQPDTKALTAIETQIQRLGDRLERSETDLSSREAVETALRDLFSQLERTRSAAIDAAENAARTAARDTLRAAMQNPAISASSDQRSDIAEHLTHEMRDLKLQHDAAERRTQSALAGLHQVVERLVGRLGLPGADEQSASGPRGHAGFAPDAEDGGLVGRPLRPTSEAESTRRSKRTLPAAGFAEAVEVLIEPGEGPAPGRARSFSIDPADAPPGRGRSSGVPAPVGAGDGSTSFIAAARRAAHASQASAASKHKPAQSPESSDDASSDAASSTLLDRARAYLTLRRRPILLSLAGLVLLLGALEMVKVGLDTRPETARATAESTTPAEKVPTQITATAEPSASPAVEASDAARGPDTSAASPPPTAPPAALPPSVPPQDVRAPDVEASTTPPTKPAPIGKTQNPFLADATSGSAGLSEGLKALAQSGDPAAEYEVGLRYVEGRSVARDPKTATAWFEKAAAHGSAPAQYRLGSAYEKGVGEPRDPAQAMSWYGRAADAGNMRAMHNLAVMTAEGAVGKPDYVKAAALFGKAAALGVRDSQFNLAILYARGLGIEQNLSQSYMWFAVAAAQGDDDAAKKRDEVGARLDPKTLEAAKAKAATFKAAPSVRAANEVPPPVGGWDGVVPPARSDVSGQKTGGPRASAM